jgi:5-methylcytosine-specific restriction protein B
MRESAATETGLARIWRTQILPLLEEHHYGDGTDVQARYGLDLRRLT